MHFTTEVYTIKIECYCTFLSLYNVLSRTKHCCAIGFYVSIIIRGRWAKRLSIA